MISLLLSIISLATASDILQAPQNFKLNQTSVVFVDFQEAQYSIDYLIKARHAKVVSTITFKQLERGYPIIDSVAAIEFIHKSKRISLKEIETPDQETKVRYIPIIFDKGTHTVTLEHKLTRMVEFRKESINSAFWMTDLLDRRYLEQYLPSNLEYDQFQMTMNIRVQQTHIAHEIFTNAKLTQIEKNHFSLVFPKTFTTSSVFMHLTTKDRFKKEEFTFTTQKGKQVPVTIYPRSFFNRYSRKVEKILLELEEKLGEWPHDKLVIYRAGMGGMEYAGATMTSSQALGHELIHSYFARSVMPANGNAGWIDEAIASWRDNHYDSTKEPRFETSKMSAHSQYRRKTDKRAYGSGANFMAYLNYELANQGGLIGVLKEIFQRYKSRVINTEIFLKELNQISGRDFSVDFDKYIYGQQNVESMLKSLNPHQKHEVYHKLMNENEMYKLL